MDILLTRPIAQSRQFSVDIAALGASNIIISPLIDIRPIESDVAGVWDGFIVTSQNALPALTRLETSQLYCVGDATAQIVRQSGYKVAGVWPTAEALVAELRDALPDGRYAHLGGEMVRVDIAKALSRPRRWVEHCAVYAQTAQALSQEAVDRLARAEPIIVPLFSPRTAALFVQQGPCTAPLFITALSQAVRQELGDCTYQALNIAALPRKDEMIIAMSMHINAIKQKMNSGAH